MRKKKIISKYGIRKIYNKLNKIFFSDIETITIDNKHEITCISIITDNDQEHTFKSMEDYINFIMNYNYVIVYFHNFGRFDSTFLLNYLIFLDDKKSKIIGEIDIIERNNIIYEIGFRKNKIFFRDSLLLIPITLKKIGETFCEKNKKIEFDYKEINKIQLLSPESVEEQCLQDCRVLKEGFINFSNIISNKFNIKLHTQLTLPALSFNIFKLHYYDIINKPISKNSYDEDSFIRKSYKGGISDVYIPYLKNGYCYDVNSLYPTVMMNEKYPIGDGKFIKGIDIDLENFIGFIKCHVICDKKIDFLTYRHPEKGLMTPIGEWIDTYTHKEVIKAIELGYKIKFLKGFKYDKEDYIFNEFVKNFYDMRKNSKSKDVDNIAKLILNSLYGRFGMKIEVEKTKFLKGKEINELKKTHKIINSNYLGNDFYILTSLKRTSNNKEKYSATIDTETAVHIASFITAYSRIFMYEFKNLKENKCYYTDTDSIFVENKLEDKYIGNKIGKFKLEYEIKEAYFVSPKVYIIIKNNDEKKIVVKGLKKEEYDTVDILNEFKKIIFDVKNSELSFERINKFKRNFKLLTINYQHTKIAPNFPLNKRKKVIIDGKWVDTEPLKVRDLSEHSTI